MAKLIYSAITSLDGYIADADGNFDWAAPDEEVHAAINDLERPVGTYLFGRRMYEVMSVWETMDPTATPRGAVEDFAQIWQAAEKVVYSTSLPSVTTAKTRLERTFDPATVRQMKAQAAHDLGIGGADLAGQALAAGLVDELHLYLTPILVGGGARSLPSHIRLPLALVAERRFASGVVHLHYRIVQ